MATYTVSAGGVGIEPVTLTAGQVDTVTFTNNVDAVQIISDGPAEVRVTVDGSTPAIGAAGASTKGYRIPASGGILNIPVRGQNAVKVVSSGASVVSVQKYTAV